MCVCVCVCGVCVCVCVCVGVCVCVRNVWFTSDSYYFSRMKEEQDPRSRNAAAGVAVNVALA